MKNHYDKIFLLVAILALAASVGYFYSSKSRQIEANAAFNATVATPFSGEQWGEVKIDPLELNQVAWAEAKPQDDDGLWLYQIFTPPKIWVDDDGSFTAEPPIVLGSVKNVFGFRYGGIKNDPYPILFKGYFIDPEGEVVVQLYDEARSASLKGKYGEEIMFRRHDGKLAKAGLVVKNFERKTVRAQDGTIKQVITVTLADESLGREIVIETGKPTYIEENRCAVLIPDGKGGKIWEIRKPGERFEADGGVVFTVKEIDFNNETILVEKVSPRPNNPNPQVTLIKFSKDSSPSIVK